jgi:hypothetical protein
MEVQRVWEKRKEWEKGEERGHVPGEYHHPNPLRAGSTSNPPPSNSVPPPQETPHLKHRLPRANR